MEAVLSPESAQLCTAYRCHTRIPALFRTYVKHVEISETANSVTFAGESVPARCDQSHHSACDLFRKSRFTFRSLNVSRLSGLNKLVKYNKTKQAKAEVSIRRGA